MAGLALVVKMAVILAQGSSVQAVGPPHGEVDSSCLLQLSVEDVGRNASRGAEVSGQASPADDVGPMEKLVEKELSVMENSLADILEMKRMELGAAGREHGAAPDDGRPPQKHDMDANQMAIELEKTDAGSTNDRHLEVADTAVVATANATAPLVWRYMTDFFLAEWASDGIIRQDGSQCWNGGAVSEEEFDGVRFTPIGNSGGWYEVYVGLREVSRGNTTDNHAWSFPGGLHVWGGPCGITTAQLMIGHAGHKNPDRPQYGTGSCNPPLAPNNTEIEIRLTADKQNFEYLMGGSIFHTAAASVAENLVIDVQSCYGGVYNVQGVGGPANNPTTQPAPSTTTTTLPAANDPADQSSVVGDPHVVNAAKEKFEIRAEGVHTLVQMPQFIHSNARPDLRVDAEVRHLVSRDCGKSFVTSLSVFGRWAEDAFGLLRISPGSDTPNTTLLVNTQAPEEFFKQFPRPEVKAERESLTFKLRDVSFHVGKHFEGRYGEQRAYLNVRIAGLKKYKDLGGLLGYDDHKAAEKPSADCMAAQPPATSRSSLIGSGRSVPSTDGGSRIEAE